MMWLAGVAVLAAVAGVGVWLAGRVDRSFDAHVEAALSIARHPSSRRRCACGDPASLRGHTPTSCEPICACRRVLPDAEPWHHGAHGCYPAREMLS